MMKTFTVGAVAALVMVPFTLLADPTGTITLTTGGTAKGKIAWRNVAKEYVVTTDKGSRNIPEDDVADVNVDRPKELADAIKKVKSGGASAASAIPALEKIAKEYSHLTYDREATRWLAEAYLAQGNATKATAACEAIIRHDEEAAYKGELAVAYWRALMKSGKDAKLKLLLNQAIASGDQTAAAAALVQRGNAAMERGATAANCREALIDGYLRVILLYNGEPEAYAEALYMGAKAFDGMQQGARADKLRQQLKAECPTSEWARK